MSSPSSSSPNSSVDFCHLSVRTEYSLIDGSLKIPALLDKISSLGHDYIALTDHGALFGALEFYKQCRKRELIPIIGCTLYMEPSPELSKHLKDPQFKLKDEPLPETFQLTLLAQNNDGYGQLIRLVSEAYDAGLKDDLPITSWAMLRKHLDSVQGSHLIALSGGCMGELYYLLRLSRQLQGSKTAQASKKVAEATLQHLLQLFSTQDLYLELVDHNLGYEKEINTQLAALGQKYQIHTVATADAYYLNPEDSSSHTLALAIKNGLTESEISRRKRQSRFHLLSEQEFSEIFQDHPEAIKRTLEIAQRCRHLDIPLSTSHLPSFPLEKGQDENSVLVEMAREGLKEKQGREAQIATQISSYKERLDYEVQVIQAMGFSGYFLIVQDFVNWSRSQGIAVGPGRGSGAGSLVAYCLGITDIDPLRWGLIFERFLNPDRISLPDFDIDFCQWRREEVIDYVSQKYGRARVAHICTYGRMMAKAAIKNVARVMQVHFHKINQLTKMFPPDLNLTIPQIIQQNPEISAVIKDDDDINRVITEATKLEGMLSHTSVHAAGIVIADQDITHLAPTFRTSGDPSIMTQYEMKSLEQVGLVKFDFLGLKTLTVLDQACRLIRSLEDPHFDLRAIPLDDADTYASLCGGHTVGIFQAESHGMTALTRKLKPSRFEDITSLVALFRPGPLGSGMVDDFIERKHLRQKITYLHPLLEPILEETYGMIVYQEQVQKIAATLAQYSLGEADLLRRAMGKKIPEEMEKQKQRFIQGTQKQGITEDLATKIFDLMAEFAKYGFNKSHSAAYGLLLYQTAYLKCHHSAAFMMGIMNCDMDQPKKLRSYIEECRRMNITVTPPCLQKSQEGFTVQGDQNITFALEAIKGIGKKTAQIIIQQRQSGGAFASPLDLAHRLDLHALGKKNLEILCTAGALDSFPYRRSDLLAVITPWTLYSQNYHQMQNLGQGNLFQLMSPQQEKGASHNPLPQWYQKLQQLTDHGSYPTSYHELKQEKALIGTYLSLHPMELFREEQDFLQPRLQLSELVERMQLHNQHSQQDIAGSFEEVSLLAFLSDQYVKTTQSGKKMASLRLEDAQCSIEALMFEKELKAHRLPSSDSYVWVRGHIRGGKRATFTCKSIESALQVLARKAHQLTLHFDLEEDTLLTPKVLPWLQPLLDILTRYSKKFPGATKLRLSLCWPSRHITWDLGVSCSLQQHFMAFKGQIPSEAQLIFEGKQNYETTQPKAATTAHQTHPKP